jgi:pyridinium-3,5-biscarboxylic acid mononucleotide sulfurtransferase
MLGLGDLAELPAAPCLSSRVETGIPIDAEVLKAIHAVERRLAQDFPAGTIRCRVRASGIVVELDPATLEAVAGPREADVRGQVDELFAGKVAHTALVFAPYRNGSAFLRGQA